ncbi:hypothetical protein [Shouchella clausii]|uniref:hypothetical protein n=1 Tax=Shouchella clausii TaxID=79880 RepID=UPI00211CAC4E|nr:hypothetical protein [Shouchella clausii]
MKIPEKIKVAGVVYDVIKRPFIEIDSNRNYQGACTYQDTEISILDDLSDERKEDVFFHELTHAIFYEAGYEEADEEMVNRIGKVLHQVFKDNDLNQYKDFTKKRV